MSVSAFLDCDWVSKLPNGQRKSTSSGITYVVGVLVLSFSRTQIATSSCEAKLCAMSGCAIESLCSQDLVRKSVLSVLLVNTKMNVGI